jgi:hypothetical protein
MAISAVNLFYERNVYGTSATYTSGKFYIVTCSQMQANGWSYFAPTSITGGGVSWTLATTFNAARQAIWYGVCSSTTTGVLTTTGGSNFGTTVDEISGASSTAVVQQANSYRGATFATAALSAFGSSNNGTYMVADSNDNESSAVPNSGYTILTNNILVDAGNGHGSTGLSAYISTNDTAPQISSTSWANAIWACELQAAVTATTNNVCIITCGF